MFARLSVFFIVFLIADRQCHGYVIAKSSVTYPAMNFFQENFTQYSSRSTFPQVVSKYTIGCGFSDKTAKDDLAPASVFVGHNYSDAGEFLDSYFFKSVNCTGVFGSSNRGPVATSCKLCSADGRHANQNAIRVTLKVLNRVV